MEFIYLFVFLRSKTSLISDKCTTWCTTPCRRGKEKLKKLLFTVVALYSANGGDRRDGLVLAERHCFLQLKSYPSSEGFMHIR